MLTNDSFLYVSLDSYLSVARLFPVCYGPSECRVQEHHVSRFLCFLGRTFFRFYSQAHHDFFYILTSASQEYSTFGLRFDSTFIGLDSTVGKRYLEEGRSRHQHVTHSDSGIQSPSKSPAAKVETLPGKLDGMLNVHNLLQDRTNYYHHTVRLRRQGSPAVVSTEHM